MDWKQKLKYFIVNILPILIVLGFIMLFLMGSKSIEGFSKSKCNCKKTNNLQLN
jgi:hypothetical protein